MKYPIGQVRLERVANFALAYLYYQRAVEAYMAASLWRRFLDGNPTRLDGQVFTADGSQYLYAPKELYGGMHDRCHHKSWGEVRRLFNTPSGQEILDLVRASAAKLARTDYAEKYRKDDELDDSLLSEPERQQLGVVLKLLSDLWATAHEEAGLLANDSLAREAINQAILDAKTYLAERRAAFAELPASVSEQPTLEARSA